MDLSQIYLECNNHLREIDKNRNDIINFYLIAIGAYLAITSKVEIMDNMGLWIFISLLLSIYGFIQAENIVEHRKWHTRYSYTARLITRLMFKERGTAVKKIIKELNKDILSEDFCVGKVQDAKSRNYQKHKYLEGTEAKTYMAFLILTCLPPSVVLYSILSNWIPIKLVYLTLLSMVGIYLLIMKVRASTKLFLDYQNPKNKLPFPNAYWLLEGVEIDKELILSSTERK